MSYGGFSYGGVGYAGSDVAEIPQADTQTALSVEVAFTTGALETPVWEDVTADVRFWDVQRGRSRELERHQPGRATIVLSNLSRQYDSTYSAGPHFGDLRPMRRVRIRETFNGVTYPVFDGFVDRWELDYPEVGHDATATLTATDAFKVFNRTELGRSVYFTTVVDDSPHVYLPLDETVSGAVDNALVARNWGSTSGNATYNGPPLRMGDKGLVAQDPGGSIFTNQDTLGESTVLLMNAEVAASVFAAFTAGPPLAFEAWCVPQQDPVGTVLDDFALWEIANGPGTAKLQVIWDDSADTFVAAVANDTPTTYSVTASGTFSRNTVHHVVFRFVVGSPLEIYVDGVLTTGATPAGTFAVPAGYPTFVGSGVSANNNWVGNIAHAAVYAGAAATAVDQAWVDRHYAAGTAPWRGDTPSERMGRVLDLVGYDARELDPGLATFQSANLEGQTALEHLQKAAETDFGLLFVARDGTARFVDRSTQATRQPGTAVYGDGAGEVGYRSIRPDDGDEVIRNSVTISRYNGVAQTATGATIDEFGRFQYTLDGLLHDTDFWSDAYAGFIVGEYEEPRRRIVELRIGPPKNGEEDIYLPAMLGPELGDAITVTHTPNGVGDPFEQVCVVEGITHSSAPGRQRTTTFALSPEFSEAPVIWQNWTPTLTNITQGNGTVVARYAQIGKTVFWRFDFTLGSTSAMGSTPTISLPVATASDYSLWATIGEGLILDTGTTNFKVFARWTTTTTVQILAETADTTDVQRRNITSAVPMTWTTGDAVFLTGTYEAA